MKCLIVTAHPLSESLCKHLSTQVEKKLGIMGHQVSMEDLYADNFNPSLTRSERESYYGDFFDASLVEEQAKRLLDADGLILVFPTWWFGFPAILKGWFDRVWAPGIAYDHASDLGPIKPRIKNLKRVMAITTLGAPWWVDYIIMRRPVKKVLKTALLGACAKDAKLQFLSLYNSEKLTPKCVEQFCKKIERAFNTWID